MSTIFWRPYYPGRADGRYECPSCHRPLPAGKRDWCENRGCDVADMHRSIQQAAVRECVEFMEKRGADYRALYAERGEELAKATYAESRADEAEYIASTLRRKFAL
jgi:undecaprenyl pyrophosphate synthase